MSTNNSCYNSDMIVTKQSGWLYVAFLIVSSCHRWHQGSIMLVMRWSQQNALSLEIIQWLGHYFPFPLTAHLYFCSCTKSELQTCVSYDTRILLISCSCSTFYFFVENVRIIRKLSPPTEWWLFVFYLRWIDLTRFIGYLLICCCRQQQQDLLTGEQMTMTRIGGTRTGWIQTGWIQTGSTSNQCTYLHIISTCLPYTKTGWMMICLPRRCQPILVSPCVISHVHRNPLYTVRRCLSNNIKLEKL